MARLIYSIIIFVILAFIYPQTDVRAYPTPVDINGQVLRWKRSKEQPTITYNIIAEDSIFAESLLISIIEISAQKWSSVEGSFLKLEKSTSLDPDISIYLKQSIDDSDVSSGFAIFDSFDSHQSPTHCTMEILVEASLSFLSIAKTILHEMGHCLGLGHSMIPQAIMSYSLSQNTFSLDLDDEAAIRRLYSIKHPYAKLPPGCGIPHIQENRKNDIPIPIVFLFIFIFLGILHKKKGGI